MIDAALLEKLKTYDTPTICNALEIVDPARRLTGFTVKPLVCPFPALPPIVGYAKTASIRTTHAHELDAKKQREQRIGYYEYIAEQARARHHGDPGPRRPRRRLRRLLGRGDERRAQGSGPAGRRHRRLHPRHRPVGAGLPGARRLHHAEPCARAPADYGKEVRVAGMLVRSGDLVHADRHGAVTIPASLAAKIPAACDLLTRKEAVILEMARAPGFNVAKLREALAKQDEIH